MDNKTTLAVAELISWNRKRSERFIGFVPFQLTIERNQYKGATSKIIAINVLQKTILKLINKRCDTMTALSQALGFNKTDEVERTILENQLSQLQKYGLITINNTVLYSLSKDGRSFLDTGVAVKTSYNQKFELFVVKGYRNFIAEKETILKYVDVKGTSANERATWLTIDEIRKHADVQAQNVQFSSKGIELQEAVLSNSETVSWPLYVCIMQSIKDNSLRTMVIDVNKREIVEPLSALFDNDKEAMQTLLSECLKEQVIEQNLTKTETAEKTAEQIHSESAILESVEKTGDDKSVDISERNTPGSVFDSSEFELLMSDIFNEHGNKEIWLISPWIKRYAFMKYRLPSLMKFLESGGRVFIGYSQPEHFGEDMVDPDCMQTIKQLDSQFEQFFYCELPTFHSKVVIEHDGNKTVCYSGSFNILSFCIDNKNEHYREEQMIIANKDSTEKLTRGYLDTFVKNYNERFDSLVDSAEEGSMLDITKLKSLKAFTKQPELFSEVESKAKQKNLKLISHTSEDISDEQYNTIAIKVIQQYKADKEHTKAFISAYCYLRHTYQEQRNKEKVNLIDTSLLKVLKNDSIYDYCYISLHKVGSDETNMTLVIDDMGFNINSILVPSRNRNYILSHRKKQDLHLPKQNYADGTLSLKYRLFCTARAIKALNPE